MEEIQNKIKKLDIEIMSQIERIKEDYGAFSLFIS